MYIPEAFSTEESPVQITHRSRLTGLVALAAAGLTILVLALTVGTGGDQSGSVSAVSTLPQYRDTPPSPRLAAQIERAATPAGYVRDPRTHALLSIETGAQGENAHTEAHGQTVPAQVERFIRLGR
jgi:hypothetical protein